MTRFRSDGSTVPPHGDIEFYRFQHEALYGLPSKALDIDYVTYDAEAECWVIIEFCRCNEREDVTPWTSHPRRYWHTGKGKFVVMWKLKCSLDRAQFYVVNYAKAGTQNEDQVKLMYVTNVTEHGIDTEDTLMSRESFISWFRDLNKRGNLARR